MIARIWRGWTSREDAEAYVRYMREVAAPDSLGTPGNRGFSVLHRPDGDREEFLTISIWESLDVIKAFALFQRHRAPEASLVLVGPDSGFENYRRALQRLVSRIGVAAWNLAELRCECHRHAPRERKPKHELRRR